MNTRALRIVCVGLLPLLVCGMTSAQESRQIVQLAKLEIDPGQLDSHKAALQAEVETALRVEAGRAQFKRDGREGEPSSHHAR